MSGLPVRLEPSRVGHVQDVPGLPVTLGWTVGLEPSRVGYSRHVRDVPGLTRTLG